MTPPREPRGGADVEVVEDLRQLTKTIGESDLVLRLAELVGIEVRESAHLDAPHLSGAEPSARIGPENEKLSIAGDVGPVESIAKETG